MQLRRVLPVPAPAGENQTPVQATAKLPFELCRLSAPVVTEVCLSSVVSLQGHLVRRRARGPRQGNIHLMEGSDKPGDRGRCVLPKVLTNCEVVPCSLGISLQYLRRPPPAGERGDRRRGTSRPAGICGRAATSREIVAGVNRFRGGLVFKAHRLVYHSTLGSRVSRPLEGTRFPTPRCGSRGTSLIRNTLLLGPYSRPRPRALWWS